SHAGLTAKTQASACSAPAAPTAQDSPSGLSTSPSDCSNGQNGCVPFLPSCALSPPSRSLSHSRCVICAPTKTDGSTWSPITAGRVCASTSSGGRTRSAAKAESGSVPIPWTDQEMLETAYDFFAESLTNLNLEDDDAISGAYDNWLHDQL